MMPVELEEVVEVICLVYHEARNVRHPMKGGLVQDPERYRKLVSSLSRNREEAWRQMRPTREKAVGTGTAKQAAKKFEIEYALSLAQIVKLYEASFWRNSASFGGNAWASISARVSELVDATSALDPAGQRSMYEQILSMQHNTGKVCAKLARLRLL